MKRDFKGIFSIWWKIFLEVVLLIVAFFIIEHLVWWTLLWFTKSVGCTITDTGFLKPGYVSCADSNLLTGLLKQFLHTYQIFIGIPAFMLMMIIVPALPVNIALVAAASGILAFRLKQSDSIYKFPILIRASLKILKAIKKK